MATPAELEKDFKKLAQADRLSHAYVLFGPQPEQQRLLARKLAHFLERGVWAEPEGILVETLYIDGAQEALGVEAARAMSDFLYRQPVLSPRRTLIVHQATDFTSQAQNALLKLVEEPPAHGLIILTVRDTSGLLPALRSRLQSFYVSPVGASGSTDERDERAQALVDKFLLAPPAARGALIKEMVASDKEDAVEKKDKVVDTFLSLLIIELAKRPEANVRALSEALKRQSAMADYSTNKKLQLEALIQQLY